MAIKERLVELRFHVIILALSAVAFFSLLRLGPSFSTVINFFWPLLLSTAFFLAAVAVLLWISPPPANTGCEYTGEELMDYVAGQPKVNAVEETEAVEKKEKEEEYELRERDEVVDHHKAE